MDSIWWIIRLYMNKMDNMEHYGDNMKQYGIIMLIWIIWND